ncbi:MAG: surface protein [Flavipsychrobacter sp.]|nr:surface protein [Flavipsychrobacter sp.]
MINLNYQKANIKRYKSVVIRPLYRYALCMLLLLLTHSLVPAQIITTIAGSTVAGFGGDGGQATGAYLNFPYTVTMDKAGNLYIMDDGNHRIRKITPAGIISTVAGNGSLVISGDGGPATAAGINTAVEMTIDAANNIYLTYAHTALSGIRKIDAAGIITTIAGNDTMGYSGDGGPATAAKLIPEGIVTDKQGNLYIAESANHIVRKIDKAGIITTIAGTGIAGYSGDGGPATNAQVNCDDLAVDTADNLYLSGPFTIRKIDKTGTITTIAGIGATGSLGYTGDGGPATAAKIAYGHLAIDRQGNIYLSDCYLYNNIRKIDAAGIITTVAGSTSTGFAGDGGPATGALFKFTGGVVTDSAGNLYIADGGNNRIRKIFNNHAPVFTAGATQAIAMCANTGAYPLNTQLTVLDTDAMQGESWSLLAAPAHGSAVVTYGATSAGSPLVPTGTGYTPAPGYSGADTFLVRVTDGNSSDTITIYVTVYPIAPITGATSMCIGAAITLSDAAPGGTWTSGMTAIATAGSSGVITSVAAGTATISYTMGTGCKATAVVTVYPMPAAITGGGAICVGVAQQLTDATTGGVWGSTNTAIATIGSTGMVTGVSVGSAIITYKLSSGCYISSGVTVNNMPAPITGPAKVCTGFPNIILSDAVAGGTWSSSNTACYVDGIGQVAGYTPGVSTIFYSLGSGCTVSTTVTIYQSPAVITGPVAVCAGGTTSLSDATVSGVWSSDNTTIATINSSGLVAGLVTGVFKISYTIATTGCMAIKIMSVSTSPAAITGTTTLCQSATTQLSDAVNGGTWSSGNTAIATVHGTNGTVSGVAAGTASVTYSLGAGCAVNKTVSVSPAPVTITGLSAVCVSSAITLSDASTGGVWSNDPGGHISITSWGYVTGVSAGTGTASYTLAGCTTTKTITVNAMPAAITGNTTLCTGSTSALTSATTGGYWISGNTAKATIDISSGVVTGLAVGTSLISYNSGGCLTTTIVTVTAPPAITGAGTLCKDATITLTGTGAGTWSCTDAAATVSGGGVVSGIAAGSATVTFTQISGCTATKTVTVYLSPSAITGTTDICTAASTTLSNISSGTWSSTASIVTVGATTGKVSGITAGTATITFTATTGCKATTGVTVYNTPGPITGIKAVCDGASAQLSNTVTGGVWSATGLPIAINPPTGDYTGLVQGTATVTFTTGGVCTAATTVTVYPVPPAITGSMYVCSGDSVTLSDAMTGGVWACSKGSITTAGLYKGSVGVDTIRYTMPVTGCKTDMLMNVLPLPAAITGAADLCESDMTTLGDLDMGTWSATGSAAGIGMTTGIVNGVSAGTAAITFKASATGCIATTTITVHPLPSAITGVTTMCQGTTTTLSNTLPGGAWGPTTDTIATANATTGVVTGVAKGTSTITYTSIHGCAVTQAVTILALPDTFMMMGGGSMCTGDTGVHVYLAWSVPGIVYDLYNGTTLTATTTGISNLTDFGLQTTGGVYTVLATNLITGCAANMNGTATVVADPLLYTSVVITGTPGGTVCAGTPVSYTATGANGGTAPIYSWKVNGVSVGAGGTSYSYTPANNDTVSISMLSNARCPSPAKIFGALAMVVADSMDPGVTITATPGTNVVKGQPITLKVTTGLPVISYQWAVNNKPIFGATNDNYTEMSPGDHEVVSCTVINNSICNRAASSSVELGVSSVGTSPQPSPKEREMLRVYPNPAHDAVIVTSPDLSEGAEVVIYNLWGQPFDKLRMTVHGTTAKIDVAGLPAGMYIIQIVSPSGSKEVRRFVKE